MPLYFAYGANMSVGAMARRCPRSKALGQARLERHRLHGHARGLADCGARPALRRARRALGLGPIRRCGARPLRRPAAGPSTARSPSRSSRRAGRGRRSSISAPTPGPESRAPTTSPTSSPQRARGGCSADAIASAGESSARGRWPVAIGSRQQGVAMATRQGSSDSPTSYCLFAFIAAPARRSPRRD